MESSNAIEDITAPGERIRELVSRGARPENRPEEEIAGYRAVLDTINSDAASIPFTPSVVEQLHRDLYQFTNTPAGRFKNVENSIQEIRADGVRVVRFQTVSAIETPAAMKELHERFIAASESGAHHPLLLIGCYVFDFLAIHPFRDGNGRISRLLTLLALYQAGYEIGRYVSIERLIEETRDTYYDALQAAGMVGTRTNTTSNRGCATSSAFSRLPTKSSRSARPLSLAAPGSARRSHNSSAVPPPGSSPSPTSAEPYPRPATHTSTRPSPASAAKA